MSEVELYCKVALQGEMKNLKSNVIDCIMDLDTRYNEC